MPTTDPSEHPSGARARGEAEKRERATRHRALRARFEIQRAKFIASMASRIAAGYAANPETSGDTQHIPRHAVEIATRIWIETRLDELTHQANYDDPLEAKGPL